MPDPLAEAICAEGHQVTVACLESFRDERLPEPAAYPYDVRRVLPDVDHGRRSGIARLVDRLTTHARRAWRRQALLTDQPTDLVHVQTLSPFVDLLALPLLRRRSAVVAVVHDCLPHRSRLPRFLDRQLHRRLYRLPDRLIALDEVVASELIEGFGVPGDRIDVIPYAIAARSLPKEASDRSGTVTVLLFGALRTNKGVDVLLRAASIVDPATVRVVVAGHGDHQIELDARRAADRLPNLTAEIGFVSIERRTELFEAADLVVLPYTADFASMSAVLLDAYAHARPVVASDVGAIGAQIRADGTGWLVAPGSPEELAAALERAAADEQGRIEAARRMCLVRWSRDADERAASYLASYEAALRSRAERS